MDIACAQTLSCIWLFVTPWTTVCQAPLIMGFSWQEYWSGVPFPSPGESSQPRDWTQVSCVAGRFLISWTTREAQNNNNNLLWSRTWDIFQALLLFLIHAQMLSSVWLFVTPWTVVHQAPLSIEFSKQEYWSGLPFPSPGDFPHPGIESWSPALQKDSLPTESPGKPP